MTFLPIAGRELRVRSRQWGTYWQRVFLVLTAVVIVAWIYFMSRHAPPAVIGGQVYTGLSIFIFIYCLLAGVRNTADCISEERREGTLGLLFLTDLKGYDVLVGKLFATSTSAFYGFFAFIPVLAIPFLMGGIEGERLILTSLALLNTLCLSLAVCLLTSTLVRSDRGATALAFLVIVLLTIGPSTVHGLMSVTFRSHSGDFDANKWLYYGNPAFQFGLSLVGRGGVGINIADFWVSFYTVMFLSIGCLVATALILPRSWQDRAPTVRRLKLRQRWRQWTYGNAAIRRRFRIRMTDRNPILWLSARNRFKPTQVWTFMAIVGLLWFWWYTRDRNALDEEPLFWILVLVNLILKWWVTAEATQQLGEDRRNGALELILSTPLSIRKVLSGQLQALWWKFGIPCVLVLVLNFIILLMNVRDDSWVLVNVLGMVMFAVDLYTLSWVGMWLGLKARHSAGAMTGAIWRILVLPWIVFIALATFAELARFGWKIGETGWMLIWLMISLSISLFFGIRAQHSLVERLRNVATEQYQPKRAGWFARMFGGA